MIPRHARGRTRLRKPLAPKNESMTSDKSKHAPVPHHWHLAEDDLGVALTDLEYAVMRTYESFVRWQAECLAAVTGAALTGQENALLHVIRMHDQAKTIKDLLHLTNRQDVPNVQYGLRKLIKLGFIEKQGSGRAGVYYEATVEGAKVCDDYAKLRKKLLLEGSKRYPAFKQHSHSAGAHLELLERLYESVTREAATFHRRG